MTLPSGAGDTPPDFAEATLCLDELYALTNRVLSFPQQHIEVQRRYVTTLRETLRQAESSLVALTARVKALEAENAALRQEGLERDVDILSKDIK